MTLDFAIVLLYNISLTEKIMKKHCVSCGQVVAPARWALGFHFCLDCGELRARAYKHCIVPMAKSNYQPVTDLNMLKQLNKYART